MSVIMEDPRPDAEPDRTILDDVAERLIEGGMNPQFVHDAIHSSIIVPVAEMIATIVDERVADERAKIEAWRAEGIAYFELHTAPSLVGAWWSRAIKRVFGELPA